MQTFLILEQTGFMLVANWCQSSKFNGFYWRASACTILSRIIAQSWINAEIIQGVRLNVYFCSIRLKSSIFVQNSQNMDDLLVNIFRFVNLKRHFDFCYFKLKNSNIEKFHIFFLLTNYRTQHSPLSNSTASLNQCNISNWFLLLKFIVCDIKSVKI